MKKLSKKQEEVFRFIKKFLDTNGFSPTVGEIQSYFGFKSPHAVTCHIKALIEKGVLTKLPYLARTIQIEKKDCPMQGIPLLGSITAGVPLLSKIDPGEMLSFDEDLLKSGTLFALRIRGDSMIEAGINNGDYVLVRKDIAVESGDIVMALLEGEATVKSLKKEGKKIFLEPANPAYQPLEIEEGIIVGKVIALYRKFA
jgi:repressor LexA